MRDYTRFVASRRALWDEFEADLPALRSAPHTVTHEDLEKLAFRYRQILHDYALVSARFPGTAPAERLRRLALLGTTLLRRDPPDPRSGVRHFFTVSFPTAFRSHLPEMGLALVLFALTAVFGWTLTVTEPALGRFLLGPTRVADLREGHLWTESLTTVTPPSASSAAIATNNMSVALTGWAGGAVAGLGPLYVVLLNGMLLGCYFAITTHYGMSLALAEFVAAHGPLEITLVLVACSAGFGLARALIVAEDRPRSAVLRQRALRSLTVVIGCLPWFLMLGFVEAFVSPSESYPASFKVMIGLALEALFLASVLGPRRREAPDAP